MSSDVRAPQTPTGARVARASVGRADLVRFVAGLPPERVARAAALLGFDAPVERAEPPPPPLAPNLLDPGAFERALLDAGALEPILDAPHAIASNAAPVPLWHAETMTFTAELEAPVRPREQGLTQDDLPGPSTSLFATPPSPPLTPWSRLWPALRAALRTFLPGRDPDIAALVRSASRGEIVQRIPRRPRRAWSERASIWIDRSDRLTPFWSDQTDVRRRLRKVCGRSGLAVRLLDALAQSRSIARRGDLLAGFRPDPQTPVLVLGDLGVYGSPADRSAWLATARRLHHAGVRVAALVPSPPARWDPVLARAWGALSWERGRRQSGLGSGSVSERWAERAERLLCLSAPVAYLQPGLLRELRRLLPSWQADAATEADVWSHPDVRSADVGGLVLHAEALERWRRRFAADVDESLKVQVRDLIRRWRAAMPKELLRAETLAWIGLRLDEAIAPPGDREDAIRFACRLEETLRRGDAGVAWMMARYGRALLGSMPAYVYEVVPSLKVVWAASYKGVDGARVPPGVDPGALHAELGRAGEPRMWGVRQVGRELVFSPLPSSGAWPSAVSGPGSPIAWLEAARPYLWVTQGRDGSQTQHVLDGGLSIALEPGQGVTLRTDRSEVTLKPWPRAPWAFRSGRDWFGLWADADVDGVMQRFRWIPPGRFRMGSPEDEAGRWEDEGPQHTVTWTMGMWLADTPVTQALWEAVMGANPSEFKSPDRPVESVSWDGCQMFLQKLNGRVRGLEARLPSEAEWEYACRAGTETATWVGDLEIRGENNAPMLDAIAWYGGNSGVGFDLAGGWDSTYWPNKQYEHVRAGTRPVGTRKPNPFGLYDMLGNVFEWCLDTQGSYVGDAQIDPPPYGAGSDRVLRGGCWFSYAGFVRAARRNANFREYHYAGQGFRLARGTAPGEGAELGTRSGPKARVAGRGETK